MVKNAAYLFQYARGMLTPKCSMHKGRNHTEVFCQWHVAAPGSDKGMTKTHCTLSPLIYPEILPKERGASKVLPHIKIGSMKHQMWAASVGSKCEKFIICVTKNSPF